MAKCPECRYHFRTLEDEEGMHECPRCGYHPANDEEEEDTGTYRGGYRRFRNGTEREDFGSDR